jgi:hypothetical protein
MKWKARRIHSHPSGINAVLHCCTWIFVAFTSLCPCGKRAWALRGPQEAYPRNPNHEEDG